MGVDGSAHSAEALRWASRQAEARGADLVAVLVWDLFNQRHLDGSRRVDPDYDDRAADEALAHFVVEAVGSEAAGRVDRRTVCDAPAPGLLEAAAGADLLVVGARGLGGFRGLLLGSVSQQVLHHATVPLAVVHGSPSHEAGPRRSVVGVDGSPGSAAALAWAVADAAAQDGVVEVVHAWEPPMLYGPVADAVLPYDVEAIEAAGHELVEDMVAAATADVPGVRVERSLVPGGAAGGLLDAAKDADLVVVGRRGLGGFGRMLLGSVSDRVVRHATGTVVVVPAAAPASG